ncbi:MAG: ATP synthase F0 subunit B [Deltaproteobacteria bacterium]|nr:MAG: ATP synthase F0 subunit B [Deltaproteobacteria bacterium]
MIVRKAWKYLLGVLGSSGILVLLGWVFATVCIAAEGAHGGGSAQFKDFLYRILNFSILVGVMYYVTKKPLANFLANRKESIRRTLQELELKKAEAEKKYEEYQGKLAALDEETKKIIEEYIQEGEREKQKIIEAANKQAQYIKEQAQFAIRQEVKTAKADLQREIAEMTVKTAEEILRKNIKKKDHDRLIDEFRKKVVKAK